MLRSVRAAARYLLPGCIVALAVLIPMMVNYRPPRATAGEELAALPLDDIDGHLDAPVDHRAADAGRKVGDCRACHVMSRTMSHPSEVSPTMDVPEHLPLVGGKVSCITCHDTTEAAHNRARRRHDGMLRTAAAGSASCLQCHDQADAETRLGHAIQVGEAHLGTKVRPGRRSQTLVRGGLDMESRRCMGCHDGSRGMGLGVSHPVGVDYDAGFDRKGPRRMVPEYRLDERIRLPGGTVGCGSCHSAYSELPAMLPMNNTRSQLCKSCHEMR